MNILPYETSQAMVRMDGSFSQKDRKNKVEETIAALGLGNCANTLIGVTGRIAGISLTRLL